MIASSPTALTLRLPGTFHATLARYPHLVNCHNEGNTSLIMVQTQLEVYPHKFDFLVVGADIESEDGPRPFRDFEVIVGIARFHRLPVLLVGLAPALHEEVEHIFARSGVQYRYSQCVCNGKLSSPALLAAVILAKDRFAGKKSQTHGLTIEEYGLKPPVASTAQPSAYQGGWISVIAMMFLALNYRL